MKTKTGFKLTLSFLFTLLAMITVQPMKLMAGDNVVSININSNDNAETSPLLPFPDMRVFHTKSFFRTQTNAVWLILVNAPSSVNMNVVLSPDPNFTITHINAPATWTCSIATNTCTRVNDGATNVFEFIQVVGTISNNAPTTITNAATLTEASLVNPVVKNDIAQVYNPSKVFQWGANNFGQTNNQPTGPGFTQISLGFNQSVGLKTDGSIVEWGNATNTVPSPAGNNFVYISSSVAHNMALTNDGHIVGWGNNTVGQLNNIPSGNGFIALALTNQASIALTNEGKIVVFGPANTTDLPTTNEFLAIAGGYDHGLALRWTGNIAQWGANNLNQRTGLPPGGGWKNIAAPSYNGIAQRQDNTLFEWGTTSNNPSAGIPTSSVESFGSTPLNSGAWAMFSDGSLTVWGDAFGAYQTNKPTQAGFVQNSISFGLNGAGILKPLSNPTLNSGDMQTASINTAYSNPLSVRVLDNTGSPVQNLNFTFTAPSSGTSGLFSNNQNTIVVPTDVNGIASTTITANNTTGAFNVTASYPGLNTYTFQLTNTQVLAKNSTTNATYQNLQDAINAAADGQTIELLSNVSESNISITNSVVIEANGFSLTIPSGTLTVPSGETMTWKEDQLIFSNGASIVNNGTIINNGTITHPTNYNNAGIYKGTGIWQGNFINNGVVGPGN